MDNDGIPCDIPSKLAGLALMSEEALKLELSTTVCPFHFNPVREVSTTTWHSVLSTGLVWPNSLVLQVALLHL